MRKNKKRKYSLYDAVEYHEKRSPRSRRIDESKTAKKVSKKPTKEWYKNPAGSDISGVDTKKYKAKSIKEAIGFLRGIRTIPDKKIKYTTKKRAIITDGKASVNSLQKGVNVRYNNVKISKRKKKGKRHDFWISIVKQRKKNEKK